VIGKTYDYSFLVELDRSQKIDLGLKVVLLGVILIVFTGN
jgi:hypothetical protein